MYVVPRASSPAQPNTEDRAAFVVVVLETAVVNHPVPEVKILDVSVVVALLKPQIRVPAQGLAVMPYYVC